MLTRYFTSLDYIGCLNLLFAELENFSQADLDESGDAFKPLV